MNSLQMLKREVALDRLFLEPDDADRRKVSLGFTQGGGVLNVQEVDQNAIWIDVGVVFNGIARDVVVIITLIVSEVAGHLEP